MTRAALPYLAAPLVAATMTLVACSSPPQHPDIIRVSGDPTSTELTLTIASCNKNPRVAVDETAEQIRLTVTADANSGETEDCADGATVTVDSPVGDRDILDENTGEVLKLLPTDGS